MLARRSLARPDEIAYYPAWAPGGTTTAELVRIASFRWAIEEGFQAAKNEYGLDEYGVCAAREHGIVDALAEAGVT
ncbi:hypothetical protein SAMN05216481_1255 [Streptomyces radiopugnans]|uniref:Transposase DDE domain-containing protein n=1 Tax=Streptomyces radiopugnans TaxID=403935 RepID=A0A1H9KKJ7_9ACTN|nr:hypothetical protein SAMN05216481_1255 [Streptomyces radiopugnans]